MPEIGNGLLAWRWELRCCCPCIRYGAWRARCAHDGVFPLVCLAAVYVCAGAFLVLVNAFVVNDFTVTYLPATPIPSFRCGIAWRLPGAA